MSKVPITELPDALQEQGGIAWQFQVPEAACNADQLFLAEGQPRMASRLAGLGGVVVSAYQGEVSTYEAAPRSITGMFGDGSAVGDAATTRNKAETEAVRLIQLDEPASLQNYNWPIAQIAVNRAELASRISDHKLRGRSSEKAWALELSGALERGIRRAANINLIGKAGIKSSLLAGVMSSNALYPISNNYDARSAIIFGALLHGIALSIEVTSNANRGNLMFDRKRWSLVPGEMQIDRWMLAAAVTNIKPMVTASAQNRGKK